MEDKARESDSGSLSDFVARMKTVSSWVRTGSLDPEEERNRAIRSESWTDLCSRLQTGVDKARADLRRNIERSAGLGHIICPLATFHIGYAFAEKIWRREIGPDAQDSDIVVGASPLRGLFLEWKREGLDLKVVSVNDTANGIETVTFRIDLVD